LEEDGGKLRTGKSLPFMRIGLSISWSGDVAGPIKILSIQDPDQTLRLSCLSIRSWVSLGCVRKNIFIVISK
jgi:hypothetical protein